MLNSYNINPPHKRRGLVKPDCELKVQPPDPCFLYEKKRRASLTDVDCVPTVEIFTCPTPEVIKKKRYKPEIKIPVVVPPEIIFVPSIPPPEEELFPNDPLTFTCEDLVEYWSDKTEDPNYKDYTDSSGSSVTIEEGAFWAATKEEANEQALFYVLQNLNCCWLSEEQTFACAYPGELYNSTFTLTLDETSYSIPAFSTVATYGWLSVGDAVTRDIIDVVYDLDTSTYGVDLEGIITDFSVGEEIDIVASSGNNGRYTIKSIKTVTPTGPEDIRTRIIFNESLTISDVDGVVVVTPPVRVPVKATTPTSIVVDGNYTSVYPAGSFVMLYRSWDSISGTVTSSSYNGSVTNINFNVGPIYDTIGQISSIDDDVYFGPVPGFLGPDATNPTIAEAGAARSCESQEAANELAATSIEDTSSCLYQNRRMRRYCPPFFEEEYVEVPQAFFTISEDPELTPKQNQELVDSMALKELMNLSCFKTAIPCPTGYDFRSNVEVRPGKSFGGVDLGEGSLTLVPDPDNCGAKLIGEIDFPDIGCPTGITISKKLSGTSKSSLEVVHAPETCEYEIQLDLKIPCENGMSFKITSDGFGSVEDKTDYPESGETCNFEYELKIPIPRVKISTGGECCRWVSLESARSCVETVPEGFPLGAPVFNIIAEYRCYKYLIAHKAGAGDNGDMEASMHALVSSYDSDNHAQVCKYVIRMYGAVQTSVYFVSQNTDTKDIIQHYNTKYVVVPYTDDHCGGGNILAESDLKDLDKGEVCCPEPETPWPPNPF